MKTTNMETKILPKIYNTRNDHYIKPNKEEILERDFKKTNGQAPPP